MKDLQARAKAARKARTGDDYADHMAQRIYKNAEEKPEEEEDDDEEEGGGSSAGAAIALLL